MTEHSIKKVLVAVDGSERSVETMHYLAGMPGMQHAQINLLHVYHQTHEGYYELARESLGSKGVDRLMVWERQQRMKIEAYLEQCRSILLAADFAPEQIKITIQHCLSGIARDIVEEVGKGYDALVLRRRGMSSIPALVMGSVALKLFNGIADVPMIFAGRQPRNNRILIGMDHPGEALRAVNFVGRMAEGNDFEVGLISVLRRDLWPPEACSDNGDGNLDADIYDEELNTLFEAVKEKLETYGIKRRNIHSEIVKNAFSRAGAIVEAAEKGNYSTIVVGRSRVSRVNAFFIGRVSNKIMQIGPKQHFWIVN